MPPPPPGTMTGSRAAPPALLRCCQTISGGNRCKSLRSPGESLCPRHLRRLKSRGADETLRTPPPSADCESPPPLPEGRVVVVGQIWAMPHGSDRLPRSYFRVEKIHPTVSMASVSSLDFHPSSTHEQSWADGGIASACGTFRSSLNPTILKPFSSFFILAVNSSREPPLEPQAVYRIFPKKGEIWAVFNEGAPPCSLFKLVEVLSDFTEEEGVTVARLEGDWRGFFRRSWNEGEQVVRTYTLQEIPLFSHRVRALLLAGQGWNGPKGVLWRISPKGFPE